MYLYYTQNYTDTSQHYPIWQVCDILYPLNGNVEESMIKKNIIINNIKLWGTLLSNKAVGHFYCSTTKLFEKHGTMQFVALSLNSSILGGPIPWFIFFLSSFLIPEYISVSWSFQDHSQSLFFKAISQWFWDGRYCFHMSLLSPSR